MPGAKKKKGGKKGRRGKKGGGEENENKHLKTIDPDLQRYYRVERKLGDCRMALVDEKGQEIIGIIRGKFRKRVWINPGDIVICSVRSFQNDRVDIVHKYSMQDAKRLVRKNEIPASLLGEEATEDTSKTGDDGLVWNVGGDSDEEAEEDDKQPQIAPQPIRGKIEDISSDSSYENEPDALKKMDTQSILDAL